ncbi:MAG: hypothetical protein Q4G62_07150 [Pseudomonadota bacterium]|nr:hypothetical protein [Pseudomonadota bacterium]
MKIKLSAAEYKLEVLSNEDQVLLLSEVGDAHFEADVVALLREVGKLANEVERIDKAHNFAFR